MSNLFSKQQIGWLSQCSVLGKETKRSSCPKSLNLFFYYFYDIGHHKVDQSTEFEALCVLQLSTEKKNHEKPCFSSEQQFGNVKVFQIGNGTHPISLDCISAERHFLWMGMCKKVVSLKIYKYKILDLNRRNSRNLNQSSDNKAGSKIKGGYRVFPR